MHWAKSLLGGILVIFNTDDMETELFKKIVSLRLRPIAERNEKQLTRVSSFALENLYFS